MIMKEICSKFPSFIRYVPYIIDEKEKIQRFLTFFPLMFKERIEYENLKMQKEALIKAIFCYDQNKNKKEGIPNQKTKRHDNFDQRKKNTNFYKNTGYNYKGYQGNNYKGCKPQNPARKEREPPTNFNKNTTQREPLKH